jgi:hypothetical protein
VSKDKIKGVLEKLKTNILKRFIQAGLPKLSAYGWVRRLRAGRTKK